MPTERLAMRRVRDVIRMKADGLPSREIARWVGAAPSDGAAGAQVSQDEALIAQQKLQIAEL